MVEAQQEYILGPDPAQAGGFAVMPLKRVHMIGGGSGTGKTTLLFQMFKAQLEGTSFLGYPTQWHPSVYVAFDRRQEETRETMSRVGLDPDLVPHHYWKVPPLGPPDKPDNRLAEIVRSIVNKHPEVKIIYFDAFYILAAHGQMNNYCIMAEWLQRAGDICDDQGLTIVGIVHSSKQREGEKITDPRYQITGSVATGGFTSTQIIVEKPDINSPEKRLVHVYPRQAAEQQFDLVVDEKGRLVVDQSTEETRILYLERHFVSTLAGKCLSLQDTCDFMAKQVGASKASTKRYLDALLKSGALVRPGRGLYCAKSNDYYSPKEGLNGKAQAIA